MTDLPMPICETCQEPVWQGFQDIQEIEPIMDKYGVLWARWEGIPGTKHYYCKKHFKIIEGKKVYLKNKKRR
jgi:hypothetical protein